jgi:hypothetical protein
MLKQLFGDEAMSRTQTHSTKDLNGAKLQLGKIHVKDNLQHEKLDSSMRRFYLERTLHSVALLQVREV